MMNHITPRPTRGIVAVRADAGGDVKATLAKLTQAFEEFKAANDERLASKADVVVDEKVDRINAAVSKLQTEYEAAVKAVKAANDRMDELESLASRIPAAGKGEGDRDYRNEASIFMSGKLATPQARVADVDVEAYRAYDEVFARFLKVGDRDHAVQAAMQVGSDPDGGYWVPTQMSNRIIKRMFETSPMRQVATVMSIPTDSVAFPTDTNDATTGGWVGETTARTTTATPTIGEQTIYVREQFAQPRVTQKLLDMATIDVEGWLNAKIADKLVREENDAFVNGDGVAKPRGFMSYKATAVTTDDATRAWGVLQYVATGAAGAFPDASGIPGASDPDSLITLVSKLKPAYRANAIWAMNRGTEAVVRKLKDADGRYMVGMGDLRDGATGFTLLGYPIVTMEDMDDVGSDAFAIAFGDFRAGYVIVDGRGIRILRDPYTDKPYVKFYTTKWVGGDLTDSDAVKLLKFGSS